MTHSAAQTQTGEQIVAAAMASRTARGLALRFNVPGRSDVFTCYAKDAAQKAAWLANAKAKGWTEAK